jgi:hypothetical protein
MGCSWCAPASLDRKKAVRHDRFTMETSMNNGGSILALTIAIGVSVVALFAVVEALFRTALVRTRRTMESAPGSSFAIGLVNSLVMAGVALALAGLADGLGFGLLRIPAVALLTVLVVLVTFGLTGAALLVGGRLFPERSATARCLLGGVALVLACLTPFVGWFGVLPYSGFLGVGGFILSLFRKPPEFPGDQGA